MFALQLLCQNIVMTVIKLNLFIGMDCAMSYFSLYICYAKRYKMKKKINLKNNPSNSILENELVRRRNALSEIRDTAYKIIAAVSAAGITLFWFLLTEYHLSGIRTFILNVFVIILAYFVWQFLSSLHRGFQKTREIIVELEDCLGLYSSHILPMEYQSTKVRYSDFMSMAKIFVIFITVSIIIVSWCQYFVFQQIKYVQDIDSSNPIIKEKLLMDSAKNN